VEIIIEHAYENDTFKTNAKTEFENDTTVDKTKYGNGDDNGIKKYLYEKYLGKAHELKEEKKDDDSKKGKEMSA
jgi:hypothetical protein